MSMSTSACPSGDEKVKLFGLLLETNARMARNLSLELEETCELPLAWFDVLLALRSTPEGRLKMNEVANAIVHSTGGTTRLIDRLEVAGLVDRQNCPNDRRAVHVMITTLGNQKLDQALDVHLRYLDVTMAARLSCDERSTLSELLTKLNGPR